MADVDQLLGRVDANRALPLAVTNIGLEGAYDIAAGFGEIVQSHLNRLGAGLTELTGSTRELHHDADRCRACRLGDLRYCENERSHRGERRQAGFSICDHHCLPIPAMSVYGRPRSIPPILL